MSSASHRRAASTTFVFTALGSLVRFASQLVLDLVLGTAGFGTVVVARTWGESFSSIADRGVRIQLLQWIPEAMLERRDPRPLMGAARRATMTAGSTLAVCLGAGLAAFGVLDWPIALGLFLVPLAAAVAVERAALVAVGRAGSGALVVELLQPLVIVLGVALLGLTGVASPAAAVGIVVVVIGLTVVGLVGANARHLEALATGWSAAAEPAHGHQRWTLTVSHAAVILFNVSDILIIGLLLGNVEVAIYSISAKIAALVGNVNNAAEQTSAPLLAKAYAGGSVTSMQQVVDNAISIALVPTVALGAGAMLVFPIIPLLLGSHYWDGYAVLGMLVVSALAGAATGPSGNTLLMTGLATRFSQIQSAHLVARVVLTVVLGHNFGLLGVAIASVLTTVSLNASFAVSAHRERHLVVWPRRRHLVAGTTAIRQLLRR